MGQDEEGSDVAGKGECSQRFGEACRKVATVYYYVRVGILLRLKDASILDSTVLSPRSYTRNVLEDCYGQENICTVI